MGNNCFGGSTVQHNRNYTNHHHNQSSNLPSSQDSHIQQPVSVTPESSKIIKDNQANVIKNKSLKKDQRIFMYMFRGKRALANVLGNKNAVGPVESENVVNLNDSYQLVAKAKKQWNNKIVPKTPLKPSSSVPSKERTYSETLTVSPTTPDLLQRYSLMNRSHSGTLFTIPLPSSSMYFFHFPNRKS